MANGNPVYSALSEILDEAEAALSKDLGATRLLILRAASLLQAALLDDPEPSAESTCSLQPWQVRKVIRFVDGNLAEAVRVKDLASEVGMSRHHFIRCFRGSMNATPATFIRRRRIELAKALMLTTEQSLAEIALACGQCDQAHLTRLFRSIMGVTPAAWRRCNRARAAADSIKKFPRGVGPSYRVTAGANLSSSPAS